VPPNFLTLEVVKSFASLPITSPSKNKLELGSNSRLPASIINELIFFFYNFKAVDYPDVLLPLIIAKKNLFFLPNKIKY